MILKAEAGVRLAPPAPMHTLEAPLGDDSSLLLPVEEDWNHFPEHLVRTAKYWQAVLKSFVVLQAPPEGAPGELAGYLSVLAEAARASRGGRGATLTVEIDADGCHGKWAHLELWPDSNVIGHLCAEAVVEGDSGAEAWLWEQGWRPHNETWQRQWHPEGFIGIAEGTLLALLRAFGIFAPTRAYVRADVEVTSKRWRAVDLRAVAALLGRVEPPVVQLPRTCEEAVELMRLGLDDLLQ